MKTKKTLLGVSLLVGVSTFFILFSSSVAAYHLAWSGRSYFNGEAAVNGADGTAITPEMIRNVGPFTNQPQPGAVNSAGYVLPNKKGKYADEYNNEGGAIGTLALNDHAGANNKEKLYNLLKDKNANGTPWEKMGSALIVHQMLGEEKNSKGWDSSMSGDARTISPTDWTDLKSRLVDSSVVMTYNKSYPVYDASDPITNTSGVMSGGKVDAIDALITNLDGGTGVEPSWVFTVGGKEKYVLEVNCANPIGGFGGFDVPTVSSNYDLVPSITIGSSTVDKGKTVSGTSQVSKTGSTNSNSSEWRVTVFTYKAGASTVATANPETKDACAAFTGGGNRTGCSPMQSETKVFTGSNGPKDYSYSVPANTPGGTKICFVASVSDPSSSNSNAWAHSSMECATVTVQFNITPTITLTGENGIINPSDSVGGSSSLGNSGPDTSTSVNWRVTRYIYDPGTNPTGAQKTAKSNTASDPCAAFTSTNRLSGSNGCTPIHNTDQAVSTDGLDEPYAFGVPSGITAGSKVCFVASVSRPTHNTKDDDWLWRHSAMRCVTVRNYTLTPGIDIDRGDGAVVEPGATGTIDHSVTNGGPNASLNVEWRVTKYVYDPGSNPTLAEKGVQVSSPDDPCVAFTSTGRKPAATGCSTEWSSTQVFGTSPAKTPGPQRQYSIPDDTLVGTKFCFVVSVSPPTANSTPVWRHSAMHCIVIGKKPKVQVWGGDIRTGGSINTSKSTLGGETYGSWSEYAALSRGGNAELATGAGLVGGNVNNDQASWSGFTFANIGGNRGTGPGACTVTFGCFVSLPLVSASLAGQFGPAGEVGPGQDLQNLNTLQGVYDVASLTLNEATIDQKRFIVIKASGTVTIAGNITYNNGPYRDVHDIPQVIIEAARINIQGNVENIDAWLFADVLNTCSLHEGEAINPAATGFAITADECNRPLRVNGPVVADKVYLTRTAGSGTPEAERGNPAEVFNLRADAYLWGYGYGSQKSRIQTVYVKELSPRF